MCIFMCTYSFNTWYETDVSLILKSIICKTQAMRTPQPISPRDRRYRHFLRIFIGSSLPKAALSHTAGLTQPWIWGSSSRFSMKHLDTKYRVETQHPMWKGSGCTYQNHWKTSYTHIFDVNIDARWCEKNTGLDAGFKCFMYLTLSS